MIRLLIVDDQDLIRDGLKAVFEAEDGISVVGEAENGAVAVRLCRELEPDVVLMDLRMPVLSGTEATTQIVRAVPHPYVLVLTTFDGDDDVLEALRAGASGYLLKDAPRVRIVDAVLRTADGESVLAPQVGTRLVEWFKHQQSSPQRDLGDLGLSPRELDVLRGVARGLSNSEIGDELYLSHTTVKSYASTLFAKIGARDRVQATVFAYESGIVQPGARRP